MKTMTGYVKNLLREKTHTTSDDAAEQVILTLYHTLQAGTAVARQLHVAPQYVFAILKKHGIKSRGRGGANNPKGRTDHRRRIWYQHRYYSNKALADLVGVTPQTMHQRLFKLHWDVDRAVNTPGRNKHESTS